MFYLILVQWEGVSSLVLVASWNILLLEESGNGIVHVLMATSTGDVKLHLYKGKDAYYRLKVCLNLEFGIIQTRHICSHLKIF
jgi:hypothetical protein